MFEKNPKLASWKMFIEETPKHHDVNEAGVHLFGKLVVW
jgi:hypothetical protein